MILYLTTNANLVRDKFRDRRWRADTMYSGTIDGEDYRIVSEMAAPAVLPELIYDRIEVVGNVKPATLELAQAHCRRAA